MVSGAAGEEEAKAEGRNDMAKGKADLAQSWEAPRVDPVERYRVQRPRLRTKEIAFLI